MNDEYTINMPDGVNLDKYKQLLNVYDSRWMNGFNPRVYNRLDNTYTGSFVNKSSWTSEELSNRQLNICTYTTDTKILFDVICAVVSNVMKRKITISDLSFTANFNEPVTGKRKQSIYVAVVKPINVNIRLEREIENGELTWSSTISISKDSDAAYDYNNGFDIWETKISITGSDTPDECMQEIKTKKTKLSRNKRKVKL